MKKRTLLIWLVIGVCVLTFVWKYFMLGQYFNFQYIKEKEQAFRTVYENNQVLFGVCYFLLYVLLTTFSLPVAFILTIASGAIFGLWLGVLISSFASAIGATCAFLIARKLLRESVQRTHSKALTRINNGIEREGGFYLFAMRLLPVFPFFVINVVMGLTPMRVWSFFWISQLGMLAGTVVYVNAGTQLAQISSPDEILSFDLLIAFALLGLLPLASKYAIKYIRKYLKPRG